MHYVLLGIRVCRDAFMQLTGIGVSSVQEARQAVLAGKRTWLSPLERGLSQSIKNTNKVKAYLGARQWLEWYASTHAEWSPMKLAAYLPGARKVFYWHQYVEEQKPWKEKNPDHPLADYTTFLEAWRKEVPWLVVCKSVCMFVRCGVCEYLKLLIEQTPRDQESLRTALRSRLGAHFQFQAAQRLAQGRLEEEAQQSQGRIWFMKIDKMDQKKAVTPTIWSQLSTALFKDLDKRLVTGLIGSMWHGTLHTTHHMRSVFDDCEHGSEMQCSAILMNLHAVACAEGHLPDVFYIGADNTYKETKNRHTLWFEIWLLCVLRHTNLYQINNTFLMVGHTHDALDRFFSRFVAAISGHDFYTVEELFEIANRNLNYCTLKTGHLSQVWHWKELAANPLTHDISGLGQVHAIRLFRSDGIYMQWKQWMTSEDWSAPVRVVAPEDVATLASFRPSACRMEFAKGGQELLDWIGKFEQWCSTLPQFPSLAEKFAWLRQAATHRAPGVYTPGVSVDAIIRDLQGLPGARPEVHEERRAMPQDVLTQLFPGSDILPLPSDNLLRIEGITHSQGQRIRSNIIAPGSTLVVRVPAGTQVSGHAVPFLAAVAVQTPDKYAETSQVLVAWWVPGVAKTENFRTRLPIFDCRTQSIER